MSNRHRGKTGEALVAVANLARRGAFGRFDHGFTPIGRRVRLANPLTGALRISARARECGKEELLLIERGSR